MESTTLNLIDEERKIVNSAYWRSQSDNYDFSYNYHIFIDMMEYRRTIAIKYLESFNDESRQQYRILFRQINEKIKQILSL